MRLLDLGCGVGRLARLIANEVKEYVGVDFSKMQISRAKTNSRNPKNVKFHQNDGRTLAMLESNYFDVAVVQAVFQHISNCVAESYVGELYRVLKLGGFFVANIPKLSYYKQFGYADGGVAELLSNFTIEYLNCDKPAKPGHPYDTNLKAHYFVRCTK